jgi:hypothetical protein
VIIMRMLAALLLISATNSWSTYAAAQATIVLAPMNVENYRVLQRVSRNAGWASTAYKNYLVGLFEGLLHAEGGAENAMVNKLFCLPTPVRDTGRLSDIFEWMETELNKLVAAAQPSAQVARIYVAHLSLNFPCHR